MLWYKAWLETRTRFLVCLATLTLFSGFFVHHAEVLLRPEWKLAFSRLLYVTQEFTALMWMLSVVLLGMGGVVHEKVIGTSPLTLSLPVSRARLQGIRAGVGLLEAVALGVAPWLAVLGISWLGKMPILMTQVGFYVLLLIGGGSIYFAMAVLVSTLMEGEYAAPAFAIGLVFLSTVTLDAWSRRFNLWRFVTGNFFMDERTFLLTGHFPWLALLACLSTAALMLFVSIQVIQRRDF